jgi:uncharacterized protein YndB with AHSA1/START domain
MPTDTLNATAIVPASPQQVFAVLTDPTTHAAISGSVGGTSSVRTGWVTEPVDAELLTASGQVFRMGMRHPNGEYQTANQVREFDPPRTVSWATGTEDGEGRLSFGGWIWRYDLASTDEGATEVRLTYDWSEASEKARKTIGFPPFGVDHLQNSLDRFAEVVLR